MLLSLSQLSPSLFRGFVIFNLHLIIKLNQHTHPICTFILSRRQTILFHNQVITYFLNWALQWQLLYWDGWLGLVLQTDLTNISNKHDFPCRVESLVFDKGVPKVRISWDFQAWKVNFHKSIFLLAGKILTTDSR